jgi:hypothetical protein
LKKVVVVCFLLKLFIFLLVLVTNKKVYCMVVKNINMLKKNKRHAKKEKKENIHRYIQNVIDVKMHRA